MAYNFTKNTCDRCGITKEKAMNHPVDTGINHPQYRYSTSFKLGFNGEVHCARCSKEIGLEQLFRAMDFAEQRVKNGRV
jgi:hypothetical protein